MAGFLDYVSPYGKKNPFGRMNKKIMGSEFLFGKDPSFDPFNQQSLDFLNSMFENGGGLEGNAGYGGASNFLSSLYSNEPGAFQAFEAPYKQQFEQQTVPMLAERFAGMGTGSGALNSSSFQQALGQAGQNLSTNLAGMRGQMQMQGLGPTLQYAQAPIQNKMQAAGMIPGQYYEDPGKQGMFIQLLQALAQGLGGAARGGF
jgi:hypothetical protein